MHGCPSWREGEISSVHYTLVISPPFELYIMSGDMAIVWKLLMMTPDIR